jgi:hypothetical protein
MGDREVFLLLTVLKSSFTPQSRHPSSFLVLFPPFVNLRTRFLLRGRVVTPRVTKTLINLVSP